MTSLTASSLKPCDAPDPIEIEDGDTIEPLDECWKCTELVPASELEDGLCGGCCEAEYEADVRFTYYSSRL